jgi:hypothetical protein
MTEEITALRLLVVEGVDERLFFGALIRHLGLEKDESSRIQIWALEGKTSLRAKFKALTLASGFSRVTSLGVVRDANDDPNAAFSSIQDALDFVDLSVPQETMTPVGAKPTVIVTLVPDKGAGMLEDVCLAAVQKDPAMACVDKYFSCLRGNGISSFQNAAKSKVQAFLASRREVKRLGEAAQAGYWPWNAQAFRPVTDFLGQFSGT